MKIEDYVKVSSVSEAYDLLLEDPSNAIMGGGAWMKLTNKNVSKLIDISGLQLNAIQSTETHIEIGAMTTLRQLETNPIVRTLDDGILSLAAGSIMGVNVRNIATLGGSIMGKYSFSDVLTALLAMDATLVFHHRNPIRLEEFLQERHPKPDLLLAIRLPNRTRRAYFYNVKKTAMDFAIINVAIVKDEITRIAIGARPGVAILATQTMEFLQNATTFCEDTLNEAARLAQKEISVGSNIRAGKDYRNELVRVYVQRGLKEVLL